MEGEFRSSVHGKQLMICLNPPRRLLGRKCRPIQGASPRAGTLVMPCSKTSPCWLQLLFSKALKACTCSLIPEECVDMRLGLDQLSLNT
eukprot:1157760-Pelagomonas_calceolata.AAC.7